MDAGTHLFELRALRGFCLAQSEEYRGYWRLTIRWEPAEGSAINCVVYEGLTVSEALDAAMGDLEELGYL